MEYAEILKALPQDVETLLQAKLDGIQFTPNLSQDEVKELLEGAVKLTKLEMDISDDEKRRLVDTVLTLIVNAGVKAIFP